MNGKLKKMLSVICAIAMVLTSMTGLRLANVAADTALTIINNNTEARTALLEEARSEDYNFALGKEASASSVAVGNGGGTDLSIITSATASFGTAHTTATTVSVGYKASTANWVQVDLGKAYDTGAIDRIAVQYYSQNTSANTSNKKGYSIQYSLNGTDFVEVGCLASGISSGDLGLSGNYVIFLDQITLTPEQAERIPYARYVRIATEYDANNYNYGLQVMGMAVLTDGTTKVCDVETREVEMLDAPISLTVTSSDYNQMEYSFEASPNDTGDYTYLVYLNGSLNNNNALPNTEYIIENVSSGENTIRVVAQKDGVTSEGVSRTVTVQDTQALLTDADRNMAIGKTATASSLRTEDGDSHLGCLTDTILAGGNDYLFRTNTADTTADVVIDLGNYYRLDAIERIVVLYQADRYAKEYTVEYSINNTDFVTVAAATGNSVLQTVKIDATECTLPAVRYVRLSLSQPYAAGFGFQMYEAGVIAKEDADLTPVEVAEVSDPAAFDVEVTGYNTVAATITAGEGQEDYKYNVYVDGACVMTGVDAGTYTLENIDAGDRVFTVKSVLDGYVSEGISVTKTVENPFDYYYETLTGGTAQASKTIDETKDADGVTYYNYVLYPKTTATASSTENDGLSAGNAVDGVDTTRWSSVQKADPQWIIIDLRNEYKIDVIDIIWQTASAKDFRIEVSTDGSEFTKVGFITSAATGSRYDNIMLKTEVTARYVKIIGTARTGEYGYSIWDLGIYGPEEEKTSYCTVSIDGVENRIEEDTSIILGDAEYGYYCDGKMYKPNSEVKITEDMAFTSVNELSVIAAQGAGIRVDGVAGIRFQATVASDNVAAVDSDVITEGMLITAYDIYENNDGELVIDSAYTKKDIKNSGWYAQDDTTRAYCGSIVNIVESNYIRKFIARAYVTITYEDGTSTTIYSGMTGDRSISQVAAAVAAAGYPGLTDGQKALVDTFAAAK